MKINFKNITIEELAGVVSKKLKEHKIESVLVGGGCVSIYSHNRYQSYDLDYVTYSDLKPNRCPIDFLGITERSNLIVDLATP